jgi:hypothetical protein
MNDLAPAAAVWLSLVRDGVRPWGASQSVGVSGAEPLAAGGVFLRFAPGLCVIVVELPRWPAQFVVVLVVLGLSGD